MESLELTAAVRDAGISADMEAWSGPWIDSFSNGTVVTQPQGAWFGGALRTWMAPDVEDWRVSKLPGDTPATLGGSFLAIPSTVPGVNRGAAWEVIKYLTTTEEAQLLTLSTIDAFPALITTYNNPVMDEPVPYFGNQAVRRIYAEVAQSLPELLLSEHDSMISSVWGYYVEQVIEAELSPEDAYAAALSDINANF